MPQKHVALFQVDAFSERVFGGNPAAVCLLTTWLPDGLMQNIAAENNCSETAFVIVESDGRCRIRWMTPETEVELCGHATLAAARVVLDFVRPDLHSVRFVSSGGNLGVHRGEGDRLYLNFPALTVSPWNAPELVDVLKASPGCEVYHSHYDAMVVLREEEEVASLQPDLMRLKGFDVRGVIVTSAGREVDFVSRFFAPAAGIDEDPVTGSAHCVLIPYWSEKLNKTKLLARQLSKRGGTLYCEDLRNGRVEIGGYTALYSKGDILLPESENEDGQAQPLTKDMIVQTFEHVRTLTASIEFFLQTDIKQVKASLTHAAGIFYGPCVSGHFQSTIELAHQLSYKNSVDVGIALFPDTLQGVVEKRRCRDVLCLLFFLAFWIGMFVICGVGVSQGNLERLIYGFDSYGFLCGTDNDGDLEGVSGPNFEQRKKLYYLNPLELLDPQNFQSAKKICVDQCPTAADVCDLSVLADNPLCPNGNQYRQGHPRCPYYQLAEQDIYGHLSGVESWDTAYFDQLATFTDSSLVCGDSEDAAPPAEENTTPCGRAHQATSLLVPGMGPCYPIWTETVDYFNRCFPKFNAELQEYINDKLGGSSAMSTFSAMKDEFGGTGERVQRYVADITKGWIIIVVGGLCTAVVVAMLWLIILRYFAGVMAWMTVLAVNAAFAGCTLFAFAKSGRLGEMGSVGASLSEQIPEDEDPTEEERQIWLYISVAGAILTGLLLLLTLVMIKRIRIAVAIIKVACQAIKSMPSLLFFPLFPFLLEVGLVIYFVFISAMLYSAGDLVPKIRDNEDTISPIFRSESVSVAPESSPAAVVVNVTREECAADPDCYYTVEWNNSLKYMFLYHLFGLLWTNQFIIGMGYVVIAGAVANFYWSRADPSSLDFSPVRRSIRTTFRYHLGSVAFGSFIVAVVQFIRLILEYIDRRTKKMQEQGNAAVKYLMCCLKCFLWLLERVIKFINRNAYIMVAVKGTGYCQSAGRAVSLLISNALRLVAVNIIGDVLLWLGKLAVTAACGLVAFLMSDADYYTNQEKYPDSYLSSPLMPVLISLLVGYVVAEIFFEVFEMTIDTVLLSFCEDCESHGGNPMYAPPLLMAAIGQSRQFHEEQRLRKTTSEA